MAYAALASLAKTMDRILTSNLYSISHEEKQQITALFQYVTPLQDSVEKFPEKMKNLEGRMREVANEAEDILEYLVLGNFFLPCDENESESGRHLLKLKKVIKEISLKLKRVMSECLHPSAKHQDQLQLEKLIEEIALIAGQVKEIVKEDGSSGKDDVERAAADASADLSSSSSSSTTAGKDAMVGFEDHIMELKDRLCGEPSRKLKVMSICGMGGSGKTTLAKNVFQDPLIMEHFDIRVWVTISQDYSAERIFSSLLESLKEFKAGLSGHSDDEKVYKILMGRKYLVVMDDIWSSEAWDAVRRVFPDDGERGSRILLTTRLLDVASYPNPSSKPCEMDLLNPDQSWDLLKKKVFEDKDCSSELEKIGKEIAGNCKGLPLRLW